MVEWVPVNGNLELLLPFHSIISGRESNGKDLYVARCLHDGEWVVGKTRKHLKGGYYAWQDTERIHYQYQVLCFKTF